MLTNWLALIIMIPKRLLREFRLFLPGNKLAFRSVDFGLFIIVLLLSHYCFATLWNLDLNESNEQKLDLQKLNNSFLLPDGQH